MLLDKVFYEMWYILETRQEILVLFFKISDVFKSSYIIFLERDDWIHRRKSASIVKTLRIYHAPNIILFE